MRVTLTQLTLAVAFEGKRLCIRQGAPNDALFGLFPAAVGVILLGVTAWCGGIPLPRSSTWSGPVAGLALSVALSLVFGWSSHVTLDRARGRVSRTEGPARLAWMKHAAALQAFTAVEIERQPDGSETAGLCRVLLRGDGRALLLGITTTATDAQGLADRVTGYLGWAASRRAPGGRRAAERPARPRFALRETEGEIVLRLGAFQARWPAAGLASATLRVEQPARGPGAFYLEGVSDHGERQTLLEWRPYDEAHWAVLRHHLPALHAVFARGLQTVVTADE